MIERRDKRRESCMNDEASYDSKILKEHVKKNGCKAPYQTTLEQFSICTTSNEIKQSMYEMRIVTRNHYPVPCKGLLKIDVEVSEFDNNTLDKLPMSYPEELMFINIGFPDHMKIITQTRAVDIHSFIGNIGGYIGLFLGKLICSPSF